MQLQQFLSCGRFRSLTAINLMTHTIACRLLSITALTLTLATPTQAQARLLTNGTFEEPAGRWPASKAMEWYNKQPWLVGCNFLPSTAVNTIEMWQKETFDPETIDRELGLAQDLGYNSIRVFLNYTVWKEDPEGLKKRFDQFLGIAARHGISTMPILFDDCAFAGKEPKIGKQDEPVPGIHNSGWVGSPGKAMVLAPSTWPDLEKYVKDLVGKFGQDSRIVLWDLYNEPGNDGLGNQSLSLVEAVTRWTREMHPSQPLTLGVWGGPEEISNRQLELSDVISFHYYGAKGSYPSMIADLKKRDRPVICTEWMSRPLQSLFSSVLPLFKTERVGSYNWGLVNGRTQTHFPWGSPVNAPEPVLWFHDIFRKDGTPYDPREIRIIKETTGKLPPRRLVAVVPTAQEQAISWRFTSGTPADGWSAPAFDDAAWNQGAAPFGVADATVARTPRTEWNTADIWLRREFDWPAGATGTPILLAHYDEDTEIYINGVLARKTTGFSSEYEYLPLTQEGLAALKPGKNQLSVHCHQTNGGQYIDVGISTE